MAVPTGVIPEELMGAYSEDPFLSLPAQSELGMLDLIGNTGMSQAPAVQDAVQNGLDAFAKQPTSMETLSAPRFFDYEGAQTDRYKQSDNFRKLGFDPFGGTENEYKYGARQTWGDVWSNGLSGMFKLAGNTYLEGWKGWGNLADAVYSDGNWFNADKLMGSSEELLAQDKATKDIMNKYAIFSTPESEEGLFNRKFFGDMLQQSGFAVGAIGQFLTEELITMGLSTEFSLAKLGIKAPAWAGKVVTKADIAADIVKLGNPVVQSTRLSEALVQGARSIVPFADMAYDINRYKKAGAGALQIASIGAGGVRRFLSEANMAMTEARMEAAGTYGELYNKLYDESLNATGQAPSGLELNNMEKTAKDAAFDNFMVNTGILMLSNRLQFDNLFSKFGVGRNVLGAAGEYADDVLKVTGKRAGQEAVENFTKTYAKGRFGTLGVLGGIAADFGKKRAAWEATKSFGKNLFKWEASEGIQELLQEGSNKGLQDYYYDLYHGNKGYDSKTDAMLSSIQNPLTDLEGAKTFLMGALTGRLLSPINFAMGSAKKYASTTAEQRAERTADLEKTVFTINAFYENPQLFLNEHIANVKVQDRAAKNMEEAVVNRDKYQFVNNKDGAFAKLMSAAMKTDMYKAVTDTIRGYGENFNDEDFKKAFGIDKTEENMSSVKDYFNKIADETDNFQKNWKALKEKYGDRVLLDLYKEGTPERKTALMAKRALDDALEILATNNYKATRSAERAVKLQTDMAAIPVLGSSAAAAFRNLAVVQNTAKETELIEQELKSLELVEKKDRATKELIKTKKEQLKSLKDWSENYETLKGQGVKEKRKFKKAVKAFENYFKSKNLESGITQEVKLDQIADIYSNLIDYIELNNDSKDYIDAYNIVANPIKFAQVHARLLDAMEVAGNKLNAEHLQEAANALNPQAPPGGNPQQPGGPSSTEAPDFMQYLKDGWEGQTASGSTDLSFDEWLKTPTAQTFTTLYNKRYNKNETLDQEIIDKKAQLEALKQEIINAELTEELVNSFFERLVTIFKKSLPEIEKMLEAFRNTLSQEEITKELASRGADKVKSEKELEDIVTKYLMPLFIDSEIEKLNPAPAQSGSLDPKSNYDVIEPPRPKIKYDAPKIYEGEKLVDGGKSGVFIVEKKDANFNPEIAAKFAQQGGFEMPQQSSYFVVMDSDRLDPATKNKKTNKFNTLQEAYAGRDKAIQDRINNQTKEREYFLFDGKEIKAGLVLEGKSDGKQYVVTTAGEPFVEKDKDDKPKLGTDGKPLPPTIRLVLLQNRSKTSVSRIEPNLKDYNIRLKEERTSTGEFVDPSIFRMMKTTELSRIYPHVDRASNEKKEGAQKRLDEFLKTTPVDELLKNMTIRIKENPGTRKQTMAGGVSTKQNPHLIQFGDKYQMQILYKGQPIGYLTNFDNMQFVTNGGVFLPMDNLSINQFRMIFNAQGKDINEQYIDFKKHYKNSRDVQAQLAKFVKPGVEVEISNEDVNKILRVNILPGSYDYVKSGEGVTLDELPYNTINGFRYVIDRSRRYGKGYTYSVQETAVTDAKGAERIQIEKEVAEAKGLRDVFEQAGRYMAVVKLPNGKIRFVELSTAVIADEKLKGLIDKINQRAKETKEKNVKEETGSDGKVTYRRKEFDFNAELNDEISTNLFLSVPIDFKGTYIVMGVTDTGNLELEFHKKDGDRDIRRTITISGKTLADAPNFSGIDDLVSQVNKAIVAHDSRTTSEIDKVGFQLTRDNFKDSVPDVASRENVGGLTSHVSKDMVKNVGLYVVHKGDIKSDSVQPDSTKAGQPITPTAPVSTDAKANINTSEPETPLQTVNREIKELQAKKQDETIRRRQEKIDKKMRPSLAMIEAKAEAAAMYDKLIDAKIQEANDIRNNRNRALKITDSPVFDEKSIVSIAQFKKYIQRILGDKVSVAELDVLVNKLGSNNITVGRFTAYLDRLSKGNKVTGVIEVGEKTAFKYHEAFHAIFRLILDDKQIDRYLALAKIEVKNLGIDVAKELQKMRESHVIYADMSAKELEDRFYEERMADQFDEWKIKKDSKKYLPGIRGIFQKILDWINNIIGSFGKSDLIKLFEDADRGKYRYFKVNSNRFTKEDALTFNIPVLKSISIGKQDVQDENGDWIPITKYLSQDEGEKLASTVASLFFTRSFNAERGVNKKQLLDEIFADYRKLYDINGPRGEFYLEQIDKLSEVDPVQGEAYLKKVQELHQVFAEESNTKTLMEAVNNHLEIMGFKQHLESDEFEQLVDDNGDRVTIDNWKETHSIGGFGSLSKFLRRYIATTTYEMVNGDEVGNTTFVDGRPLIQAVNANTVYNGVLKAVSNISDQKKLINRLFELRNSDTETGRFLEKFFNDTGLEVDSATGEFELTNPKQATLFQQVVKGFQQYTVDYLFINKDIRQKSKKSVIMLANRMGAAKTQFSQWQNAYVSVFETPLLKLVTKEEKLAFATEKVGVLQDLLTTMDPDQKETDEEVSVFAHNASIDLRKNLGISISPIYIKFSIAASKKAEVRTEAQTKMLELYDEVEPITPQTVKELMKSLLTLKENPFARNLDSITAGEAEVDQEADETEEIDDMGEGGNVGRINAIAHGNAVFDETVNSTSFKNGEGELVYAHQLPTFHLAKVMQLNDPDAIKELLNEVAYGGFLYGHQLLSNDKFNALLGNLKVERIESMKSSILNEDKEGTLSEDKTIKSNQNSGVTYGSFSDREFLISLLELYKYNKEMKTSEGKTFATSQHLIRVIEASNTGDTVSLPIINAVTSDQNDKVSLSTETVEILTKEVLREVDRILSVKREIETGFYTEGEIQGYHYAVDGEGRRDPKKRARGQKFYKMRNVLGAELATEIEDLLYNDSNADLKPFIGRIESQIKSYWDKQIDRLFDTMTNLNVLTEVKQQDGSIEYTNNLVDDFIFKGHTTKSDGSVINNERMNALTNLKPGQLRHNLGQILVNDYINTLTFNQLLYGDEAKAFKDEVDQVKRAKGANGSGASLSSYVIAKDLGINHKFDQTHILTFSDPKFKALYAGGKKDKADAQSYTTVKGMRYTRHGLGKLTPAVANILDKIERGEKLTSDEIFHKDYGLKAIEAMFNSEKLIYFDGPMYIKTSTVMLTKELTSVNVNGEWVARIGYEELHNLRVRMEQFERDMDAAGNPTVAFAAPATASKGRKTNVFDNTMGFSSASNDQFVRQDTNFWRLQLENPSNKIIITDPSQAKQIIVAEQDDDLDVDFMGTTVKMKVLKEMYFKDTDQRIKNNYIRTRDEIFDIQEVFKELGKSVDQDKVSAKLGRFQKTAIETLKSTGADSQMLEFFAVDEVTGEPKYNLNSNVTLDKYAQLFLAYFSKGVMSEKSPGHSLALMSNYGVKVVKVFTGRYDENGVPIGEVVPRAMVETNYNKYKDAKRWNNDQDREFEGLNKGDIYVDDLRHNVPEYDAKGKIIGRYTEFMMPPHFLEDLGINLAAGDKIPSWLAKAFGVRIPSQAKHSFVSLKLVDYMPAYYGSTGVFAQELIEISGADFDIDKLYMHIMDTYNQKGKRIPYGTAKSKKDKFNEYKKWNLSNNKTFKTELKELKKIDPRYVEAQQQVTQIEDLQEQLRKVIKYIPESERQIRESFRTLIMTSRFIDGVLAQIVGPYNIETRDSEYSLNYDGLEDTTFAYDLADMIESLDTRELKMLERENNITELEGLLKSLPSLKRAARNLANQEARLISVTLEGMKLPNTEDKLAQSTTEMNNGVLNNRILEQKLVMLTNSHVVKGGSKSIAYEVASLSALSDLLNEDVEGNLISIFRDPDTGELPKELAEILLEGGTDVDSIVGKFMSFKNNKEGARNIGPAVNGMLVYAIFNTFKIPLRSSYKISVRNEKGELETDERDMFLFKLDGNVFNGYGESYSFNSETGKYDGDQRIFNMISTVVSAMTDNAKERLAARLGLNIEAVGYVANMLSQGVPIKSAILFVLQPVIRDYFKETKLISNNVKTNIEANTYKSEVAKSLLAKYLKKAGNEYVKPDLTTEMLISNIKDNGSDAGVQAAVMQDFIGIINQSFYFSATAKILKLTKGLGTSMEDYQDIEKVIDQLGLKIKDDREFEMFTAAGQKSPPPFDLRQVMLGDEKNGPVHHFVKGYIQIADQISELSKSMFIERTSVFKRIKDVIENNFNVKFDLVEQFNKDVKKDLISYLSIKAYRKMLLDSGRFNTLSTMSNALIYDEAAVAKGDKFKDIIDVTRLVREKMPNNYFINYFVNAVSTTLVDNAGNIELNKRNKDGINKLESNTWAKLGNQQIEKLRDSLIDIYQSDIDFDGMNGRDMASTLFNYLLVKDGAQFRSGSYLRYMPNFMFDGLLKSTGLANDVMKLNIDGTNVAQMNEEYKKVFGVTPLELFNEFMEIYTTHVGNGQYVVRLKNGEPKFKETGDKEIDDYKPESFNIEYKNDKEEKEKKEIKGISINIFRGVRKNQATVATPTVEESGTSWMSDEEYTAYMDSLTEAEKAKVEASTQMSRGHDDKESGKFRKNMELLEAKGFSKNKKNEVRFPYIIKISNEGQFASDSYYILKSVKKYGGKKNAANNNKLLMQKDETVASGVSAYYVPVERKGSKKTFKAAGVFDAIPDSAKLPRRRNVVTNNTTEYNGTPETSNAPKQEIPPAPQPVQKTEVVIAVDTGSKTPKQLLKDEYGIDMIFTGKGITFAGDAFEFLPQEYKDKATTPLRLLQILGFPLAPAPDFTTPIVKETEKSEAQESTSDVVEIDTTSKKFTPDEITAMIASGKSFVKKSDNTPLDDKCANDTN